ncbi:MAG: T9SS type A sorting domain-containing protein, partial [Romboutsia sp.]|nr:T9SS type A sorting domain-containing protein [Romboutsia sp.]
VSVLPSIDLDAGNNVQICEGETITLTATGSGEFLWSTGETSSSIEVQPSKTTTYSVIATNGNCSETDMILVTVEEKPWVDLEDDLSICFGESVIITAEGNGDFLWSTGETSQSITVSPEITTKYSVTVTNGQCGNSTTDEVYVYVKDQIIASAGENITIQQGEKVILEALGGSTYFWSTGETTQSIIVQPFETTIYNVEVGNGTCSELAEVEVTVIEKTLLINDGLDITICRGEEVTLTASGGTAYLWDTGDMKPSITVKPNENRVYSVSSLRNNEVYTADIKIVVEDCAIGKEKEINIYPNPTSDVVNIHLPGLKTKVKVIVYALNGSLVYNKEIKADNNGVFTQIDMSSVAKGIYLIRIFNNEYNETKKILVV